MHNHDASINHLVTQLYSHTDILSHSYIVTQPGQSTMSPSRCTIINHWVTQLYSYTFILLHGYTVTQMYTYSHTFILSHSYTITYKYVKARFLAHSGHHPGQSMSPLQCAIMMFIWSHTKPYNFESKHRWRPFFLFSFWQSTSCINCCTDEFYSLFCDIYVT